LNAVDSSSDLPTFQSSNLPSFHKTLRARSISQTVVASLRETPFHGRVWSCFPAACNLADEAGRVVSLVTVAVGDGSLNVVVEGQDPFAGIEVGAEARIDGGGAIVGGKLAVHLEGAAAWNPLITWGEIAEGAVAMLWRYVQDRATPESLLTFWAPAVRLLGGARMAFHEMARDAAERLLLALRRGERTSASVYASTLAGLGPGATPAGDDFLQGLMAGLRAWPQFLVPGGLSADLACASIGPAAAARTHVFSAAHLRAAQAGQMDVGWHRLAAALAANDETAIQQAADCLLAIGATSGADAMAGFLGPYLLTDPGEA
jgi:hypothetical protein